MNKLILLSIFFFFGFIKAQQFIYVDPIACTDDFNCLFNSTISTAVFDGNQLMFELDMQNYISYSAASLEVSIGSMTYGSFAVSVQTTTDVSSPLYEYSSSNMVVITPSCPYNGEGYCDQYYIENESSATVCSSQSSFWYVLVTNLDNDYIYPNVSFDIQFTLYIDGGCNDDISSYYTSAYNPQLSSTSFISTILILMIVAIVVSVISTIALIVVVCVCLCRRNKRTPLPVHNAINYGTNYVNSEYKPIPMPPSFPNPQMYPVVIQPSNQYPQHFYPQQQFQQQPTQQQQQPIQQQPIQQQQYQPIQQYQQIPQQYQQQIQQQPIQQQTFTQNEQTTAKLI